MTLAVVGTPSSVLSPSLLLSFLQQILTRYLLDASAVLDISALQSTWMRWTEGQQRTLRSKESGRLGWENWMGVAMTVH